MSKRIEYGKLTYVELTPANCRIEAETESTERSGVRRKESGDFCRTLPKRMCTNLDGIAVGMAIEFRYNESNDVTIVIGEAGSQKTIFDPGAYYEQLRQRPGTTLKNIAIGIVEGVKPDPNSWLYHGFIEKGDHPLGDTDIKDCLPKAECTNGDAIVEGATLMWEFAGNKVLHVTIGGKPIYTNKKLIPG